jgi:hypothetical protein
VGIDSCGVGDEADAHALEFGELAFFQDIDSEFDVRGLEQRRVEQQPREKEGCAGEGHASTIGYRRGAGDGQARRCLQACARRYRKLEPEVAAERLK